MHSTTARRTRTRPCQQLDERKIVDRAKGILMKERGMTEEAAYELLRKAAMNENLPHGAGGAERHNRSEVVQMNSFRRGLDRRFHAAAGLRACWSVSGGKRLCRRRRARPACWCAKPRGQIFATAGSGSFRRRAHAGPDGDRFDVGHRPSARCPWRAPLSLGLGGNAITVSTRSGIADACARCCGRRASPAVLGRALRAWS